MLWLNPPAVVTKPVPPVNAAIRFVLDPASIVAGLAAKLTIAVTVTVAVAVTAAPEVGVTVSV
jgi:hypothetical protein